MSIKYMNGFDYLPPTATSGQNSALLYADGWYGINDSMYSTVGRFGLGTALRVTDPPGGSANTQALFHVWTPEGYVWGGAVRIPSQISSGGSGFRLFDSQTNLTILQVDWTNVGVINIAGAGRNWKTRTGGYRANAWFYLQIKHTPTLFEVKINGDIVVSSTSGLTDPIAFDTMSISSTFAGGQILYDDLYIVDIDGEGSNDYLGNIRVGSQLATANGSHIDLTPVGQPTNYQNANNYLVPGTDYNYTPDVGDYDLYVAQSNVAARDVFAVQMKGLYYQDNGVQLYGANVFKIPGQALVSGNQLGLNQGSWGSINDYFEINPGTGVAFTAAELNTIEMGPSLAASD